MGRTEPVEVNSGLEDTLLTPFSAVILAGGRAARLDGVDKASVEIDGRTLLTHALEAVLDAREVVVVGEQVPTDRPVTFTLEDPRYGGPAAALLSGCDQLLLPAPKLAVIAVDMPRLTPWTLRRLHEAAAAVGVDGAVLGDRDGRRQLAMVLDRARLAEVSPDLEDRHDLPLHRLLEGLRLVTVLADHEEHRDVDTWADLRDLAGD